MTSDDVAEIRAEVDKLAGRLARATWVRGGTVVIRRGRHTFEIDEVVDGEPPRDRATLIALATAIVAGTPELGDA